MLNISVILGILAAIGVVGGSFMLSDLNTAIFFNSHAILIVIGGTLAASLLSFSLGSLLKMVKVFFQKVLFAKSRSLLDTVDEMTDLARGYRQDAEYLKTRVKSTRNPFLGEALEMVIAGGVPSDRVAKILTKRARALFLRYEEEGQMFKIIAKFPPAFGLMGTTLGMIGLMQGIGGEDSMKMVGPAMGIALVATFYGICFANLILIPMGEHLSKLNREDALMRKMVIDGIIMIQEKQHHLLVAEELKSYLLPSERIRSKEMTSKSASSRDRAA
jgi:chemotaxis protein MotA